MRKPEPAAELPQELKFVVRHPGDPIDMEFIIQEVEGELRNQLIAVRLETAAAVYRSIADGAARAAKIVGGGG